MSVYEGWKIAAVGVMCWAQVVVSVTLFPISIERRDKERNVSLFVNMSVGTFLSTNQMAFTWKTLMYDD